MIRLHGQGEAAGRQSSLSHFLMGTLQTHSWDPFQLSVFPSSIRMHFPPLYFCFSPRTTARTQFSIHAIPAEIPFSLAHLPDALPPLFHSEFFPQEKGIWQEAEQLKADGWKPSLLLVPVRVSDSHSAWESRFPGRTLGDISHSPWSWLMESLGILQPSPPCLGTTAPGLPWWLAVLLEGGERFCWPTRGDPANMWQWRGARRISGAPAAPATSPEPVTSAVAGRQLAECLLLCLIYLCHLFCPQPSSLLVK